IKQMRGRLWGLLNRPKPKVFLRRSSEIRGPLAPSLPRRLVLIGASMGGPAAIVRLFEHLEADLPISVLVAQHMPERFTKSFAERLGRLGGLQVEEACGRKPIVSGTAWICPGGQNMEVKLHGKELFLEVVPPSLEERYVPSVDRLFHSAAEAYGSRVVGVVLTGMGDDGKKGAESIKRAGGLILCESEETAVAYGMPSNVVQAGLADEVLPIHELAVRLARLARSS
ncbi:MAG: CheB methylesterase domain-containing protein, partial [Deltaproteobacteria bacterium]|nr:CheB methylesterase domain-containing protein [Deltaproteobacteria bacterium]